MKLAFVTSCLAPGKDGVGDYTRLLAEECERQGHACVQVALNDRFVAPGDSQEATASRGTLRLSAASAWSARLARAQRCLSAFAPDWVSLQFVGYGYHRQGIAHRLAARLRPLVNGTRLQIMFHELWIGAETGASWKHRLIGAAQRWTVLGMLRRLQPQVVQTTTAAYQGLLEQHGVPAGRLPLFSPVPVLPSGDPAWVEAQLRQRGVALHPASRHRHWFCGFFGTLHPVWPPEPLFARLHAAACQARRRVVLCALGRTGAGQPLWQRMTRDYAGAFDFCHLGEQPPERVSACLHAMDFGIATTPLALLGKSGTATAMLEHGLPVIVNRNDVHFRNCPEPVSGGSPMVVPLDRDLPVRLRNAHRQPPHHRLPEVTRTFLNELQR